MGPINETTLSSTSTSGKSFIHCSQIIIFTKDSFTCIICYKKMHVLCAEGSYTEQEAEKLRKGSSPFEYICHPCKLSLKNRDTTKPFTVDEITKHACKKYEQTIADLKTNENQLLTDTVNKNTQIRDLTRKLELIEEANKQVIVLPIPGNNIQESTKKRQRPNKSGINIDQDEDSLINTLNNQSMVIKGYTDVVQTLIQQIAHFLPMFGAIPA